MAIRDLKASGLSHTSTKKVANRSLAPQSMQVRARGWERAAARGKCDPRARQGGVSNALDLVEGPFSSLEHYALVQDSERAHGFEQRSRLRLCVSREILRS